ncbi:MAG: DUF3159 domain-containing protein [Actinomycetaceae bacterium]|nr:DUF3159 domain-containing protein [Arcanobacterium sp.]MDD7686568.1 DUF3159 domain-containing protein [Actinomycetaceae bacterium]MDY5272848.1 DUF3159 domain-containing protein [Arcanobacterium sp.]
MMLAESKKTGGLAATVVSADFDALQAVGGWRGIVESVLPTLVFLVIYVMTRATMTAVAIALVIAVLAIAVRALQRVPIAPALGGLLAMAISAFLAWRTGEASNVFLWGILTNAAYGAVLLISILARWPLLGVLIALFRSEGMAWRTDPESARVRARYYHITWIWVALFALRLAVQLPLYYAHLTEALGLAKLALGLPLFALAAWFSWMLVPPLPQSSVHTERADMHEHA